MTPRRPLPPIVPCPCGKGCAVDILQVMPGTWRAVSKCGFAGPMRYTKRTAREAWNRRSDAEAERRGEEKVLKELLDHAEKLEAAYRANEDETRRDLSEHFAGWAYAGLHPEKSFNRGEVLPAKPEKKKARKR